MPPRQAQPSRPVIRKAAPSSAAQRWLWRLAAVAGISNLLLGIGGGLLRIGGLGGLGGSDGFASHQTHWAVMPAANAWHGALMICGFFGTVISLERAVAIKSPGGALAPLAAAAGGWAALAGQPTLAYALWLLSAAVLLALYGVALMPRLTLHAVVEACGAAAWGAGTLALLLGRPISMALLGWCTFLVLTIAGERRELSQFVRLSATARASFIALVASLLLAVAAAWLAPNVVPWGVLWWAALWWAACGTLAMWLLAFDFAPRQWSAPEWRGHMAQSLSVGYVWLAVAAVLGLADLALHPQASGFEGPALHALLLGFVFAMVFGHAPIMLPALAGLRPAYVPWARAAVWVMAASLALRIAATLQLWPEGRAWAGRGHALALLIFITAMLTAVTRGRDNPNKPRGRQNPEP